MPDRRDDLDSWLDGRIDPLPPPPGTFDLIKKRARRRKYRRLAVGAGAAAVIVAAAVAVPQMVNLPVLNPPTATSAANGQRTASAPSANAGGAKAASSSASEALPAPEYAPVPPNFRPSSVTFVSTQTGFVIGQAGTPGHCASRYCTSVAWTLNAGRTWHGLPAPVTSAADGATGVSQIRFLNGANSRAFALFASCTGTGPAFAARCTSYTLYSSPASADDWTPVGPATSGLSGGAASMVLTGTRGYLLAPDRMLYSGSVHGRASWQPVARIPCPVGEPLAGGQ